MDNTYMTIQERIELIKKSKAFSPFDAARKVFGISETMLSEFFGFADFSELEAEYLGISNVPYSKFCSGINNKVCKELSNTDKIPYQSRFGILNSDLIYSFASNLAALPFRIERNPHKKKIPRIYRDLRMTLGNYLDALIDISYNKEKKKTCKSRANEYRKLKKELSELIDLSTPLCKAIDKILEQYKQNRIELSRIDNIIGCSNGLKFDLQFEEMKSEFSDYDSFYDYDDEFEEDEEDPEYEEYYIGDGEFEEIEDYPEDDEEDENEEVSEDRADKPAVNTVQIEDKCIDKVEFDKSSVVPVAFVTDDEEDTFEEPADKEEHDRIMADIAFRDADPLNYYLSKAKELPNFVPSNYRNPEENREMSKEHPNILMVDDFSPEALKAKMDIAELDSDFRKIAEETITEEGISNAIKNMDAATDKLYHLLILPFAGIDKFTFDHHLDEDE